MSALAGISELGRRAALAGATHRLAEQNVSHQYPQLQNPEERTAWIQSFDGRYGHQAYARLLSLFDNVQVSYAEIAAEFGVTRECVRQWHNGVAPGAPRGHQRRRARSLHSRRRRLLEDTLFRTFVRAARGRVPSNLVAPVSARDGFRRREVRLGSQRVLLKRAVEVARGTRRSPEARVYVLFGTRTQADFVFFVLGGADFLFVPTSALPATGVRFVDTGASPYAPYKNCFDVTPIPYTVAAGRLRQDESSQPAA